MSCLHLGLEISNDGSWQKHIDLITKKSFRDRPFNLKREGGGGYGFLFRSECFIRTTQELEFFFCRAKRENFFQSLTLGYMIKTLNQIIFFFLHQNQNIFFSNIGNQNIFFRKKTIPPFKLNGRSLTY